jgi:hypothetical protein
LHIRNMAAQLQILFALGRQLLPVAAVPRERVFFVLVAVRVRFFFEVFQDAGGVQDELPVVFGVGFGELERFA